MESASGWREKVRDRRWVLTRVGIPTAAVVAVGVGIGVASAGGSDADGADGSGSTASAAVERRDLVERETFNGSLGYADERSVIGNLQGTVTRVAEEGSVLERGEVLYRVDQEPVVLMYGATPAWRAMTEGDEGADVRQLERNLVELGFDPDGDVEVDGEYDWATTAAVRDWQEALGVDETGAVELGQVVFLDGARRVGTIEADIGSTAVAGRPVMITTSTRRSVTVELDARRQDLVKVGDRERVELPGGDEVTARVSEVGAVATAASADADPSITVTLTLASASAVSALDEAPVDVEISKEEAEDALSVPVTALLALAGGGYGVEVREEDGTRVVAVEAGLFADGFVEISGDGIEEGAEVVVPA
jgi:peptidoglycan hydrolase-like protein with peptidoglycan-binding domain